MCRHAECFSNALIMSAKSPTTFAPDKKGDAQDDNQDNLWLAVSNLRLPAFRTFVIERCGLHGVRCVTHHLQKGDGLRA
jgi:hypothetical protein